MRLVYLGFIIPLVFWGTTILCGLMNENYNHLTNMVSELGTIGTKTQYIFTTGLVLLIMILGFLTLIPNVMDNYFGVK